MTVLRRNIDFCESLEGEFVYSEKENKCKPTLKYLDKKCKKENINSWWNKDKKVCQSCKTGFYKKFSNSNKCYIIEKTKTIIKTEK